MIEKKFETEVEVQDKLDGEWSYEEVGKAVKKLSNDKAGGVDGLLPWMVKKGGDVVVQALVKLVKEF